MCRWRRPGTRPSHCHVRHPRRVRIGGNAVGIQARAWHRASCCRGRGSAGSGPSWHRRPVAAARWRRCPPLGARRCSLRGLGHAISSTGAQHEPPPAEVACVYPAGAAHAVLRGAGQAPPGGGVQHASPPNAFDGPSLLASGAERGVAAPGTGFGAPAACGSRRARVGRANEELATMPATALRPPASPLLTACTRCHPEKSQTHRKPPGFRRAHSARQAATNDRQRSLRQEEACEGCSVRGPERCR